MNIENKNVYRLSIIIPCYNAEKFLVQCFNTLQQQSYKHWEAICVDDGSYDDTLRILKEYALTDIRIKVYTQQNQGAAKAREYGISKATGDYVTFLDVDDTLVPGALQTMVSAFTVDADIVVSGYNVLKHGEIIRKKKFCEGQIDNLCYLKQVLCGRYGWELWAKMYRKALLVESLETPVGIRIGEDAAVFIQLVCRAKRIKILAECLYNYIQYSQSASHIKSLKYAEETLQSAFFIEDLLKKEAFYEQIKREIDAMFLLFYSNSSRKKRLEHNHPLVSKLRKEHFNLNAFRLIPSYKAVYICLHYLLECCR